MTAESREVDRLFLALDGELANNQLNPIAARAYIARLSECAPPMRYLSTRHLNAISALLKPGDWKLNRGSAGR